MTERFRDLDEVSRAIAVIPDAALVVDKNGLIRLVNERVIELLRYSREDLLGQSVEQLLPESLRPAHAMYRSEFGANPVHRKLHQGMILTALSSDGLEIPVEIGLNPVAIDGEDFVVAVLREAGERQATEALLRRRTTHLRLLQLTNEVANDSGTHEDAIALAIRQICEHIRFDVGHCYVNADSPEKQARSQRDSWYLTDPEQFSDFVSVTDRMSFRPGEGVPGTVMDEVTSLWIEDVTEDPLYLRRPAAAEAGLRTALFIPVRVGSNVVAVLEFYSRERHPEDPELLEALNQVGLLLGRTVERKRSQEQAESDARFRDRVMDAVGDGLMIVDRSGRIEFANHWIERVFEEPRSSLIGAHIGDLPRFRTEKDFDDFPVAGHPLHTVFESGEPVLNVEVRSFGPRNGIMDLSFNITPLPDRNGEIPCAVLSVRDVTEQKRFAHLLSGQHDVLEAIVRGASLTDVTRRLVEHIEHHIVDVDAAILLSGEQGASLELASAPSLDTEISKHLFSLAIDADEDPLGEAATSGNPVFRRYYRGWTPPGSAHQEEDTSVRAIWAYPFKATDGSLLGVIALFVHDPRLPQRCDQEIIAGTVGLAQVAVERDVFERQLAHQAFFDELTGLPKRALLMDRIEHAQQRARRTRKDLAVLFVDLDEFKSVNDSLGHHAGDELLREAADRLSRSIRSKDTVVRFAGDEFVIVLEDIENDGEVNRVIQRIQQAFDTPLRIQGLELYVSCSIGVARQYDANIDAEGLIRRADHAMYRAKESGRGIAAMFTPEADALTLSPLAFEANLRVAVAANAFELVYQPVYDLRTGELYAFETLIRWHDEELGEVPPDVFLPVAQNLGLMPQISSWVFAEAMAEVSRWRDETCADLRLMLNVSSEELLRADVLQTVRDSLRTQSFPPERVVLEISEQAMIETRGIAADTLEALREDGVQLALDDFGTGYASLSYLHRFPVNYIKLDQSFLSGPDSSHTSQAVISGIVQIAQTLGIRVIAEGVESDDHWQFVRDIGCDLAQGYYFAPPLEERRAKLELEQSII